MPEPVTEDIETVQGKPEAGTSAEDSTYDKILAGEAEAPLKPEASAKTEDKTTLDQDVKPADTTQDPEIELELGGKVFTMKQSEAVQLLENASKFADREKTLSEKEKSLNRDYTQKSQQIAEFRKSVETNFGRMPEQAEMQALGKLWKSYFQNPQAKQAIDQILSGRPMSQNQAADAQNQGKEADPYVRQLEQKIFEMEEKLGTFSQSIEERAESEAMGKAEQTWNSWVDLKSKSGTKITDEIDTAMAPFITALKAKHPDWDSNKILDTAYRHATIDDIEKTVQGNILKSADEAKKGTLPRIKPRTPAKSDKEKTYAEIMLDS